MGKSTINGQSLPEGTIKSQSTSHEEIHHFNGIILLMKSLWYHSKSIISYINLKIYCILYINGKIHYIYWYIFMYISIYPISPEATSPQSPGSRVSLSFATGIDSWMAREPRETPAGNSGTFRSGLHTSCWTCWTWFWLQVSNFRCRCRMIFCVWFMILIFYHVGKAEKKPPCFLVGGLEHFIFSHTLGILIPVD